MSKKYLTRRNVVIGFGAVGVAGVGWVHVNDEASLMRRTLAKRLPDAQISDPDIRAYANDFLKLPVFDTPKMRVLASGVAAASGVFSLETLASFGPGSAELTQLERVIVTNFVISSDYLAQEGSGPRSVKYFGYPEACVNPWAQFDCHPDGTPI